MSKLRDATKQVEAATRDLQREQQEWQTEKATLQRENLQLKTSNRALEKKKAKLETELSEFTKTVESSTTELQDIRDKITDEAHKLDSLESRLADKATELADLHKAIASRKATTDTELEAYATERKEAIKAEILEVNKKLVEVKTTWTTLTEQIGDKQAELATLNQAAIQEEADLKMARTDVDQQLVDKQAELVNLGEQVDRVKKDLQRLVYDRDNALITIQKAKDEHQKFVDYETRARKVLDAKDRELQDRAAEISEKSQFLDNSRSFLPKL